MAIVVHKYGGTSVADTERIRFVAERVAAVRERGDNIVVVVSAMAGRTDALLALAHEVSEDPDRRELDMLLSVGERISMTLLAMALKALGHDAKSFTGSQSGIITNDAHAGARIIEVRPYRIQDELDMGRIVIVAGYQGVSYRKEVTTLGRGGSDTTAVALAAALGAESCEIYSDIEGVHTADPRVVTDAQLLPEISHEDMQELARCGAKVLNAHAVEFARRAGIALFVRSTFTDGEGTVVRADGGLDPRPRVVGVTACGDRRLLDAGEVPDGALCLAALPTADGGVLRLIAPGTKPLAIGRRVGTVSIVGERAGEEAEVLDGALSALRGAGVEVGGTLAATRSVTLLVAPERVDEAVRVCHGALIPAA
jgi:aspartate kinase